MGFDPFPKLGLSLFMCKRLMSPRTRETCEKMAGEQPETIVEEREELMVPLTTDPNPNPNPTLRTAHFLKPSLASINQQPLFKPPSLSSPLTDFEPGEWPLKLVFTGWIDPQKNWKTWVDQMHPQHQSTWRKAGINEAIMCSTYKTRRNHDLFWGLAERWCPSTNSFIFPWGEATITLEDIIVLGGFSVIGEPVSKPLETTELMKLEENLLKLLTQLKKTLKSCHQEWMKRFMGKGSELEHIAFLSLWLSRYVFGLKFPNTIGRNLLSVAIHLARGTRLALGPAVLASIYRDLSLLKETIIASTELRMDGSDGDVLSLALQAPLRLVQIWAWERFPGLRPEPNAMNHGEPRIARWHGLKRLKIENVRMVLDSAQDCFQWRPYATTMSNWSFPKFYIEKEEWMVVDPYLDQELQSFAQCLRVCELVGIDCIELYLPHRVAMQFGIDQDLPCTVTKSHESPETAWSNYGKPIWNAKLYVPSRLFEGDVTTQYLAWWKQSTWPSQAAFTGVIRQPRSLRRSRRSLWGSTVKKEVDDNAEVPPGFLPKYTMVYPRTSESYLRSSKGKKGDNDGDVPPGFDHRSSLIHQIEKTMQNEAVPRGSEEAAEAANESDVYNTPKMNDNEGQNRSYKAVEIPGLELEARISRLERVIAELKAERLTARLTSITKQ